MRLDTPRLRDNGGTQPTGSTELLRNLPDSSSTGARPHPNGVIVTIGAVVPTPFSGEPSIDTARVAAIQAAIRDGSYMLEPARAASAMIASKLLLSVAG